jgi:PAS domain S-box-containing protein
MPEALVNHHERDRQAALNSYNILDTVPEQEYDDLTALASLICDTPVALISLVDQRRQWFKSAHGLSVVETDRAHSFCAHAIIDPMELMEIEDASLDPRFTNNPLVTGDPHIAFYAGVPLVNEDGYALGSLCVIGSEKKKLSAHQRQALKVLARQVMDKLELRRKAIANEQLLKLTAASNARNLALIEQAPVAIILFKGPNFVIESANQQMLALLGKPREIIGQPLLKAIPELDGQDPYHLLSKVLSTGTMVKGEETPVTLIRDGKTELGYYTFTYSPLRENGKVIGVIDMAVDVTEQVISRNNTERLYKALSESNAELAAANEEILSSNEQLKASQELLMASEERFRSMADNISQLAWMARPDGYIYWYNKRWYDYTGTTLKDMQGWGWQQAHHPGYVDAVTRKIKLHFENGLTWEDTFPLRDQNGNYQWFLSRAVPTKDEQGRVMNWFGTNTEITDQIIAREKLEAAQSELKASIARLSETEQKQQVAISQAKLGTFSIDAASRTIDASPRLKEFFGYGADEHMTYADAIAQISPEFRQQIEQEIQAVFEQAVDFHNEFSIIGHNDGKKRWVRATGKMYVSESDPLGHFSGTLLDITEQKEDDIRKNDFIAMVSHELKTPLTSLNGFVQILELQARKNNNEKALNIVDKAKRQIRKMTTMINGFLNVSRLESGKIHIDRKRFDMKELVKEIEEETVPANTSHHIIFDPVLNTWVEGDRDKIGQVITNFISNALKYSAPGTTVQIACLANNGSAMVSVRDEGLGIAEKDIDHLFDRFYRVEGHQSKKVSGFGIGLYLCWEIIQRHQGEIWVESKPQVGSTFFFSIPIMQEQSE